MADLAEAVAALPGVRSTFVEKGEVVAHADRDALLSLLTTLRDDERFAFEQVMDICGVDWPERAERFDVVYNLLSVSLNQRLRVIVTTDENTPVPSVHTVWPVATWWEREAWDLFGIVFSGQPDLRRILTDYGFEGHPLRKDFPLTGYVEVMRDIVLFGRLPSLHVYLWTIATSVFTFYFGYWFFDRYRNVIVDVI